MKKKIIIFMVLLLIMSVAIVPGFSSIALDETLAMYATDAMIGPINPITINPNRTDSTNALYEFDAIQNAGDNLFYSLASHDYTKFSFDDDFYNIMDTPTVSDIEFSEVTWGESWHPEAALVFLTGAQIGDIDTNTAYVPTDGSYGYYAGIIWNKVGIQNVSSASRTNIVNDYATDYGVGARGFIDNTYALDGNFGITQFKMPEEVVFAEGVILVDITSEIYGMAGSTRARTYPTGKDGYDLDAIRAYTHEPIVIAGTITGQKLDAPESPLYDVPFEVEIFTWVDNAKGERVAKAQSDILTMGAFLFSVPGDIDTITADNLILPGGEYYIEEVNIPLQYAFVKFVMVDGLNGPGPEQGNGARFTITTTEQTLHIEAYNEKVPSNFTAYKYDASKMDPMMGFYDYSFDFVLFDVDHQMDYAYGHSLLDGSGLILWDLKDTETVEMLSEVDLPDGNFIVMEVAKEGFTYMGANLMIHYADMADPTILPVTTMSVPFAVVAASEIRVEFMNDLNYRHETAYAYYGDDSLKLNDLRKNNNWGWYANLDDIELNVPYDIYAGAGGNDISKGVLVGTVTFSIVDNHYQYELDFTAYPGTVDPVATEVHFGVYDKANKIPKGPGQFTNLVLASDANFIVLHLVVEFPTIMPE